MLILEPNEVCLYKDTCPYTDGCWGIKRNRNNKFTCEFVDLEGNFVVTKKERYYEC